MKMTGPKQPEQDGLRHRHTSRQQVQDEAKQSSELTTSIDDGKLELDTSKSAKKIEIDYGEIEWKIHGFPASLQGVGERYIRPKLVTIGPYHTTTDMINEEPNVSKMKDAATCSFVTGSIETKEEEILIRKSIDTMFMKVSRYWHTGDATTSGDPIKGRVDVRSLYEEHRIATQSDDKRVFDRDFLFKMFRDGCFLLQFIRMCTIADPGLPEWLENWFDVNKSLICSDIMLLENQLPWVVLATLKDSRPDLQVPLQEFVSKLGRSLQVRSDDQQYVPAVGYKPAHLLGYLWHYKTGGSIREPPSVGILPMSKTVSVIELADIGIYLTSSKTTQFKDMAFTRTPLTGPGTISLATLLLDQVTSCWLVNMAAFEVCIAKRTKNRVVSSYLALLAMLMDGEDDVHELRATRIVQGDLTNKEILDFCKTLSKHIRPGHLYFEIMEEVQSYRVNRFIWTFFHSLLYNCSSKRSFKYNYTKTIMTTMSLFAIVVAFYKLISIFDNRLT
uniref:Uncharacterized protein n=1 Tax=Avena sativa TaxID=4498 RepID=A0ACD5VEA2_AVESA